MMTLGVDMYKKEKENILCLLVVILLAGIKRVARIVAIVPSKRAAARKDKNAQRGEHGQQNFLPHNLTYIYLQKSKRMNYSRLLTLIIAP